MLKIKWNHLWCLQKCLEEKEKRITKFYKTGSKSHNVSKYLQKKKALVSSFDDKRYILKYES